MVGDASQKLASYGDMGTSRKPLNTFGQFLAGMIGCESMQLYRGEYRIRDTINLSRFKLNCLYESQGLTLSNALKFFWESSAAYLHTPLDVYRFAYILVEAPIQWDLTFSTSFDLLVTGLVDHASDGKVLGSCKKTQTLPLCQTEETVTQT